MNTFMQQAQLIKDEIISYRRTIHQNPEVALNFLKQSNMSWTNLESLDMSQRKYVKVVL